MRRSFDLEHNRLEGKSTEATMSGGHENVAKVLDVPTASEQLEWDNEDTTDEAPSYQEKIDAQRSRETSTAVRNAYVGWPDYDL